MASLQAEVKYVPSGLSGRLAPLLSSSTTSSRIALLLSLLSLVLLLTLLALGLSSLSSLPTRVEEQGREVRRLEKVLEQQQEELASLLVASQEERRAGARDTGEAGRCSLPASPGPCTTASLQR